MKKVLMLRSKHEVRLFDASTPAMELEAFMKAFQYNLENGWYECFDELDPEDAKDRDFRSQFGLHKAAKKGDAVAARKLLLARRNYEYEGWDFAEVD